MSRWVKRSQGRPEPPTLGTCILPMRCSSPGVYLQPRSWHRNPPCHPAGQTPPPSPSAPPNGSWLDSQPVVSTASPSQPGEGSGAAVRWGLEQPQLPRTHGGAPNSCPRLRGCPWQRSRAGPAVVTVPGWAMGFQHPPAPPRTAAGTAGAPASSARSAAAGGWGTRSGGENTPCS